jgi:serine protease
MNVKKHRDSSCVSTTSRSIESVLYAADNGADVVSMSFSSSNYNATFEAALQEAGRNGVVSVSSGGNGGRDNDRLTRYPNEYDVDASIIVGNSSNIDALYEGANFGANSIDLAAPGTNVMSTSVDSPFAFSFGTGSSYSAGFAAGAVTLTLSAFPMLTPVEVVQAIKDGAERLDSLNCNQTPRCVRLGARIDTWGALQKAAEIAPAALTLVELKIEDQGDGDGIIEANETVFLVPMVSNAGRGGAFKVQASLQTDAALTLDRATTDLGDIAPDAMNETEGYEPLVVTVPADCTAPFTATLQLQLTDHFDRTWDATSTVQVECAPAAPADAGTGGQDAGDGGLNDAEGCTAVRAPSLGLLGLLLVGLFAARRRRANV